MVSLAQKATQLPLGALFGFVSGGILLFAVPALRAQGWTLGSTVVLVCVFTGVGIERVVYQVLSWKVKPKIQFLEKKRTTDLKLDRIEELQAAGKLKPERGDQFADRNIRDELIGPPRPRGPRGPYRKRQPPAPPRPSSPGPDHPAA